MTFLIKEADFSNLSIVKLLGLTNVDNELVIMLQGKFPIMTSNPKYWRGGGRAFNLQNQHTANITIFVQ